MLIDETKFVFGRGLVQPHRIVTFFPGSVSTLRTMITALFDSAMHPRQKHKFAQLLEQHSPQTWTKQHRLIASDMAEDVLYYFGRPPLKKYEPVLSWKNALCCTPHKPGFQKNGDSNIACSVFETHAFRQVGRKRLRSSTSVITQHDVEIPAVQNRKECGTKREKKSNLFFVLPDAPRRSSLGHFAAECTRRDILSRMTTLINIRKPTLEVATTNLSSPFLVRRLFRNKDRFISQMNVTTKNL